MTKPRPTVTELLAQVAKTFVFCLALTLFLIIVGQGLRTIAGVFW